MRRLATQFSPQNMEMTGSSKSPMKSISLESPETRITMKRNKLGLLALGTVVLLCAFNLWAQQAEQQVVPPASPPKTAPHMPLPSNRSSAASALPADTNTVPEWVIYEVYLGHVTRLEEAADQEEKA